ncbi:hypothetical protein P153DRAFT_381169 [Dothidotthia symphoricarpi CBS 119687]|uniref:Uncharacterized protein n=1 Tax=Dothidotthia symphoricarpi CBS 119687 TaxID=1392245 RepID=A0A6A6AT21_9PLEO|nr:uncharacterized protein P153DRAFT_381169 [Dothidotthia symphoricarpi CBS 119687]KAF2133997.1 hypothetical protein P153DRAFT_381169 [Dothidotthia symphoricarpi CBS 119687]
MSRESGMTGASIIRRLYAPSNNERPARQGPCYSQRLWMACGSALFAAREPDTATATDREGGRTVSVTSTYFQGSTKATRISTSVRLPSPPHSRSLHQGQIGYTPNEKHLSCFWALVKRRQLVVEMKYDGESARGEDRYQTGSSLGSAFISDKHLVLTQGSDILNPTD